MKTIKKTTSILLTFAVIISVMIITPITAAASLNPERMTFEEYIVASLESFTERIEIGYYIRNNSEWLNRGQAEGGHELANWLISGLIPYIIDNNPQLFNVRTAFSANWVFPDFSTFTISPEYIMTPAQYAADLKTFNVAAMQVLNLVRDARNDFEKALILHNYVVLNTTYDNDLLSFYEINGFQARPPRPLSHTAYGSLINKLAVCDGYAKAYMHLLKLAGIESRIASGNVDGGISHAWIIIYLDGSWYHIDPTWNDPDPTGNSHGSIIYDYYLVNGNEIGKTHFNWEWATADGRTTNSTTFSNAFFRSAKSAVVILDDYFYWLEYDYGDKIERGVDNNLIKSYNMSTGRTETVHSFEAIWYAGGTENNNPYTAWPVSRSGLAAYNGLLYFSTAKEILSFDPVTGAVETVHVPANLGGTGNRFIFGMTMHEEKITYSVKTEPNASDNLFTVSVALADSPQSNTFTTADALVVLRYGAGLNTLTVEQRLRYDLNGDGAVTTADALIILRIVAGVLN
ncbi:MAG: hypothetical protein FWD48_01320 [Oscillospiraceae bacterium]|nr:hypothetical protein [Oscillospiraceae bacterium]